MRRPGNIRSPFGNHPRRIDVGVVSEPTVPASKRLTVPLPGLDMPATRTGCASVGLCRMFFPFNMRTRIAKARRPIAVHTEQSELVFGVAVLFQESVCWSTCSSQRPTMGSPVSLYVLNCQESRICFTAAGTAIAVGRMNLAPQLQVQVLIVQIAARPVLFFPCYAPIPARGALVPRFCLLWILLPPDLLPFLRPLRVSASILTIFSVNAAFAPRAQAPWFAGIFVKKRLRGRQRGFTLSTNFGLVCHGEH
jgi:hypothetical protein